MSQLEILIIFFLFNLFLVINFDKIKFLNSIIDKPDKQRKFHKKPTALAGGIILILNLLIYFIILKVDKNLIKQEILFSDFSELNLFILTCFLVFILGYLDDKFNFNPIIKFFFSIIIISFFILLNDENLIKTLNFSFLNKKFILGDYSFLFTLFCYVVFLNAFNMFDGINLQASSYSLIILIYFLAITQNSILLFILIIFILFFKYLNSRNKSFLGDNGSLLISFIISFILIKLFNQNLILFSDEIFVLLMIPGVDMIRLFFERIKNQRNPLSFDRLHLHHLLIDKFSHTRTLSIINFLIILPIICIYLKMNNSLIILSSICIYLLLLFFIRKN